MLMKVTHSLTGGKEKIIPLSEDLKFECDKDGDITTTMRGPVFRKWTDNFEVGVILQTWKDNEVGWPRKVKAPPEIRVLHMTISIVVKVLDPKDRLAGTLKVEHNDVTRSHGGHALRGTGSADPRVALIETFVVELVQPVSKLNGLLYRVRFAKDSFKIDLKEGSDFDTFLRESIINLYEVRVALEFGKLELRGECRASATFKGTPAERSRYNQQLSEKRRLAVVDWMSRKNVPNPNSKLLVAVGDRYSKPGEEDPNERRCDVIITPDDLLLAVHVLWMTKRYLGH
jgi:hypothetical protein